MEITSELRILWAMNSLLIVILGWFIRAWINSVKTDAEGIKNDVKSKADAELTEKEFGRVDSKIRSLFRHKHPIYKDREKTGEVIIE